MEKEITIFDYLPKVLPIIDLLFIIWIAICSPAPWITTPIHIAMPVLGFTSMSLFKKLGTLGFYLIGIITCIPVFFLNLWGSPACPTWMAEFAFIAGGLLLTTDFIDRLAVLGFVFVTSIFPLWMNHNSFHFIITITILQIAIWFLMERSMKFIDMQKQLINRQKHLVEEKQKEILDSIHYAKRIQQSFQPTEKYIDKSINRLKKEE